MQFSRFQFRKCAESKDRNRDFIAEEPISLDQAAQDYAVKYDELNFWQKCKRYANRIGRAGLEKVFSLYYATQHKDCTLAQKAAIYGALGYLLTPIDVIPDLTPFFGYSDDISLISSALIAVASLIDEGVKEKAKVKVEQLMGETESE